MKKILVSVVSLVILSVTLISCNSGPKANASKFLNGFYHMDYDAAKSVSTEDTKKQLDFFKEMMVTAPQTMKDELKKIKIEIKDTKAEGNNATVTYIINGDPQSKNTLSMLRENGEWHAKWDILAGMNNSNTTVTPEAASEINGAMPLDTTLNIPADNAENRTPVSDSGRKAHR